jgi:alkylhydroperoxidase family enzyme
MKCEAGVTPEFKRLIGYMTSYTSGCRYCQAHTILGGERFGSTEERLNDVWIFEDSPHFSDAEKAALRFARAAAMVPNEVDDKISDGLREHWDHGEIVEIMAVIALFGYLNRWNDSMGSALEELPIQAGDQHLGQTGWEVGKHQ